MRILLLVQFFTARANDGNWAEWTDWSACENDVYNRIRRCFTDDNHDGRNIFRLDNGACGGHHQEYRSCGRRTPCLNGDGSDYDGTDAITSTGKICARWDLQPEEVDVLPEHIHNNFCRNPDGSERPWCYVEGGEVGEREDCEIQPCEEMEQLGFTFESAVTMHLEGTALGPTHSVDIIESGEAGTQMRACCPDIVVCGQADEHAAVTGQYHFNSRGRYYKHNDADVYYYYDRRFKKWLISESMYNHQTYGYLNSSVECPALARESPLMAYDMRFMSGFAESSILTGCIRSGSKNQVYQCSVPTVLPEIATSQGPVGLNGNSRTIISASEYFGKFTRIQGNINVEEAIPGSWPHQVSLQGPKGHFCGAALINPDFVLTSARCAQLIGKFGFSAVLGVHDVTGDASQRICIRNTITHPDFNSETGENDMAVIRLAWSATMDSWTNPACIMHDEIPPSMVCVATGWGSARNDPLYYPKKLQQYPIPFKRPCHTQQKLCAGTGGIGACTADVGSPLACYSNGKWLLAGIASAEGACEGSENTRNYFMRASLYEDWINEVMESEGTVATWGGWTEWTECSRECGVGIRTRDRVCNGSGSCEGTSNQKEACMSGKECSKLSHPLCRGFGNKSNGKLGGRIVGGNRAEQTDWPFIVMIAEKVRGKTGQFCGGTLISERWVMSAGHCFQGWGAIDPKKYKLWAGAETRYKEDEYEQEFYVTDIICHDEFLMSSNTIVNDICLMKTDRPIKFNENVRPICLPEEIGGPEIGQMCTVGGWGDTMGTGNQFALNEVQVPIITYDQCQNWYDDEFIRIFEKEHLCAGYEQGQLDACQGDSGGPFICHHDVDGEEVAVLQGVVSFGVGCAEARNPGVYTRLTNYLDFVSSIVIDACAAEPCINGGLCTLTGKTDYACDCRTGFSGKHCEVDEIALQIGCKDDPCMNDAVCTPAHNTYRCECQLGWAGRICDREVPQCKIPYSGGGGRIIGLGMIGISIGGGMSGGIRGRRDTNETDIARSGMNFGGGIDRDIYDNRIVGGEVSVAGAWPWIVQISDKFGQYCSGVIVGNHFVLTAQPCVHNTEPEEIYVVAGAFQVNTPEDNRAVYSVSSIHCNKGTLYKEDAICILHISEEIMFDGNYVQPMCMPDEDMVFSEGSRCFLAGWGETLNNNDPNSDKLHELEMPLFSDEHCHKYYQQKNIRSYNSADHVCAGYFDQRGACTGDAGGPLMCLHGGSPTVAGILSWAEGCRLDSVPAVFSDLTAQLSFVKSIMDDPCLDNPCENGGSCGVNENGGYTCACADEFGGTNCETDLTNIDDCADEPCKNGGTCSDELGGFTCACTDEFYGPTCEEQIAMCSLTMNGEIEGPRAKFPWAAFMRLGAGRSTLGSPFCAATIVGPRQLLTTASCVFNIDTSLIGVEYGFEDPAGSTVSQVVESVHVHPLYTFYEEGSQSFDIAIVRMVDDFAFGNYVQPACVSKREELPMGAQCKLSGIGEDGQLREAKLTKVVMEYCKMWNPTDAMNENYQLCTNYIDDPVDTCMSGVGGAIWCTEGTTQPYLHGVTAYGKSCDADGNPGVATSVPAFYSWIQSHIERDESACTGVTECDTGSCVEATESDQFIVQWPGYVCQGLDACEDGVDICPAEASCVAKPGTSSGYECDCGDGYEINGSKCVDIDECVNDPCGEFQSCWNTDGAYECICGTGTHMVEGTCVDINECENIGACGSNTNCTNIEDGGGYECECMEGFEGDPYRECTVPPQFCNHPKSDNAVKSSVILTGCVPPFEHGTNCYVRCSGGKELSTDKTTVRCECIGDRGGCTWDQTDIDCIKATKPPTTTRAPTTRTKPTTKPRPQPKCPPLNALYKVMPPVYLDCGEYGGPVHGARCLVKCNDSGARSNTHEVNCSCRGKKCKWLEWKQLRKNEIKCLSAKPQEDESSDRNEAEDTFVKPTPPPAAAGPQCPPMPKTLKKYFNKEVTYGTCGTKEPFSGVCKLACPNGEKPNVPKLTCACKKSKCKVKELKKIKKGGGLSCSGMSRTAERPMDILRCPNPFETYGHLFSYGVNMDCSNYDWGFDTTCAITCNGMPNVGLITCLCDEEGECNWDKKRIIKKKGIKCITSDNPKYGRKRFMQKLKDRSGITYV